jgi:hypothetical protein
MTTMTMPTTIARIQRKPSRDVSQIMPLLVSLALLVVVAAMSLWISGPMH